MYYTLFTVTGRGIFPFDMLRYDTCYPRHPEDAQRLVHQDQRTVQLVMTTRTKDRRPTEGRWASFGWTVTDITKPVKV